MLAMIDRHASASAWPLRQCAYWSPRRSVEVPRLASVGVDLRVLGFAVAVAALTAVAFGVVPAILMAWRHAAAAEGIGAGGDAGGARPRAQPAGCCRSRPRRHVAGRCLAAGAGASSASFSRIRDSSDRVVTVNLDLPNSYRDFKKIADYYDQLLASLRAQPGVTDAGLANFLPLDAAWRLRFLIEGRPSPAAEDAPLAQHQSVDDDYFKVIGVPLLKGRPFEPHDTVDAPGVVVINEALARREWPNQDPIGQQITTSVRFIGPMGAMLMPPRTKFQVVGVVANLKNASLALDSEPAMYFSYRQFSFRGFNLVVKGQGDAAALVGAVRASVQRLDPSLPLSPARTLDSVVSQATDRPRALMLLMGVFAAIALGLAALGIYGVLSYAVNQRQQELSVRMALGAQRGDLLWLVVRQGMMLTLAGAVAGVIGALALGQTLSSLLFGVTAADLTAFGAAVVVSVVTALFACWLPARRAASMNPLDGLRT
jgi:putative ABC transport system permease protein